MGDLDPLAYDYGLELQGGAYGLLGMCRPSCCREREIVRYLARPPKSNNYRQHKYQQKRIVCGKADSLAHRTKNTLPRYLCRRADVSRLVQEAKRFKQGIVFPFVNNCAELTDMLDEYWDSVIAGWGRVYWYVLPLGFEIWGYGRILLDINFRGCSYWYLQRSL